MDFIDLIIWPLGTPFVDKPMWGFPHVDSQEESINPTLGPWGIIPYLGPAKLQKAL